MSYTVVFTPEAEAQLTELYGYIAAEAHRRSQYRMIFLAGRGMKPSPAMNDDVVGGKTVEPGGCIIPLALSPAALQRGDDLLFRGPVRSYVDARLIVVHREQHCVR